MYLYIYIFGIYLNPQKVKVLNYVCRNGHIYKLRNYGKYRLHWMKFNSNDLKDDQLLQFKYDK